MGIREDFYTALQNQFNSSPSKSFLFSFFREERQAKGKDFAQAPMDELLELLANRNQKLQLNEKDHDWLCALSERTGDREILECIRGDRAKYKRLQKVLGDHPEVVSEQELIKLRKMVLNAVVIQDAQRFLYDARASLDRDPPRKKDHILKMLDAWFDKMGLSLCQNGTSGSGALTDTERQTWDKMFCLLQIKKHPTSVILPVRANPGVGLYLVGRNCFTRRVQQEMAKKRLNCAFICLVPTDYDDDEDVVNGFHLTMGPVEDYPIYCATLDEGEKMFSLIWNSHLAYNFICEWNADAPKGTPEPLQIYFESQQQTDDTLESLADEGRKEVEGL